MSKRIIFLPISIILCLVVFFCRDPIIVQFGIRIYEKIQLVTFIFIAVSLIFLIFSFAGIVKRMRKESKEKDQKIAEYFKEKEMERQNEGILSVEHLDAIRIKNNLQMIAPPELDVHRIIEQFDEIQELKTRNQKLLRSNQADALNNTEDVIEQVEQQICRNVRKVMNYITVIDTDESEQIEKARETIRKCEQDNDLCIKKTQDFLFALADFLNTQGESSSGSETIDMYRKTLLKTIQG